MRYDQTLVSITFYCSRLSELHPHRQNGLFRMNLVYENRNEGQSDAGARGKQLSLPKEDLTFESFKHNWTLRKCYHKVGKSPVALGVKIGNLLITAGGCYVPNSGTKFENWHDKYMMLVIFWQFMGA